MPFVTRFLSDRTHVRTAVLYTTDDCVMKSQVLVHNFGRGFNVESSWIRGEKGEGKKGKGRIKIHSQFNCFNQEAVTTFS